MNSASNIGHRRTSQADSGIGVDMMMQPANDFRPGTAAAATTKIDLRISCQHLIDKDTFSKSDPMVVVFAKEFATESYYEIGRTECIKNTLNPEFVTKITVDFYFEERQLLKMEVYDIDSSSVRLCDHDFLGRAECSLGEVVANSKLQRKLTGVSRGGILIIAEEQSQCKDEVTLHFTGEKLDKKDFFGKSDPFLAFYKTNLDGSLTVVHRTEYIPKTLNPTWKPFTASVRTLCSGDLARPLTVRCFDWNRDGSEDLIGEFRTSVGELLAGQSKTLSWQLNKCKSSKSGGTIYLRGVSVQTINTFVEYMQTGGCPHVMCSPMQLINERQRNKKPDKYKNSGVIRLSAVRLTTLHSLFDFVHAGTQMNCTIAIDYTASNGNPRDEGTLHFHQPPHRPSQYALALSAVGNIIQDYDSDKLFPVLGYGARLPPVGEVSHNFYVNGNTSNPYCAGVDGVLTAYENALRSVQLYGPTNFAPIITHVAQMASQRRDGSEYFILLIITDGIITDMARTKDAIVNAASLPLSIIIVGVGSADFKAMQELDGDTVRLTNSRGVPAERDIVQFVPFRDFQQSSQSSALTQARLAKEVLAEIPQQFLTYMRANNIKPAKVRFTPPAPIDMGNPTTASAAVGPDGRIYSNPSAVNPNEPPPPYTAIA